MAYIKPGEITYFDVSPGVTQDNFTTILLHVSKSVVDMSEMLTRNLLWGEIAVVNTPGDLQVSESANSRSHERSDQFTYIKLLVITFCTRYKTPTKYPTVRLGLFISISLLFSSFPIVFQGCDGNGESVCGKRKAMAARRRTARTARVGMDEGFLFADCCWAGFGEWAIRKVSRWEMYE